MRAAPVVFCCTAQNPAFSVIWAHTAGSSCKRGYPIELKWRLPIDCLRKPGDRASLRHGCVRVIRNVAVRGAGDGTLLCYSVRLYAKTLRDDFIFCCVLLCSDSRYSVIIVVTECSKKVPSAVMTVNEDGRFAFIAGI